MIEPLARAATALGADGLFFETHPHPATAPSDHPSNRAMSMLPVVTSTVIGKCTVTESHTGVKV